MRRPHLLFVASDRPKYEDDKGYAGAHGRILDRMLAQAGITRDSCEVVHADSWVEGMERDADCVVLGGEVAATTVLGGPWPTSDYHGTVLPLSPLARTGYDAYRQWCHDAPKYVLTYDIPLLHARWDWHPLAARDWDKAGRILRGEYRNPDPDAREWIINEPSRLHELADSPALLFDTELSPQWMIGFANERQVHVCDWSWETVEPSRLLLQSPSIVKVAHNLQHDLAMCELRFGFPVARPYFDTYGGATLLNTALERTLSPGIATRFTDWPHHKWLFDVDATHYNGLDNIVGFDAYGEIVKQLRARGLWHVAEHDHDLLEVLYEMQREGFVVSEGERKAYESEQAALLQRQEAECGKLAEPIIRSRVTRFEKPHLFKEQRQCQCCGGGKIARTHCWRCGGLSAKPTKKSDYGSPDAKATVASLRSALPMCSTCQGTGKIEQWLAFNPGSGDQVADVLYRGLRIPARKYKGKETVAAAQLEPLQGRHPLVAAIVTASKTRADLKTVERLTPGTDSKLHCVFDPWGTESGRVASKEGLLEPGTNAMNIPKKARRFVVPGKGRVFLYPDFSQIEARAVAVLSQDAGMLRAFTEPVNWPGHPKHGKIDSHTVIQQLVSQYVEISRDQSKRTTYALIYGGSGEQLAVELSKEAMQKGEGGLVTAQQGCNIREAFFLALPRVRVWHQDIETELVQTRSLKAPSGRERHWPGRIMDTNKHSPRYGQVLAEVVKQAWAFKPQEMGAHIMALGVMEIRKKHRGLLTPHIHVHDAVLFSCREQDVEEAKEAAIACLSRTYLGMWFPSEMKVGANWYEAS